MALYVKSDRQVHFILLTAMVNAKKAATLEERLREDAHNFKRAGMGPIAKTYALDSKEGKELLAKRRKGKH